jgi:hypothetical protein
MRSRLFVSALLLFIPILTFAQGVAAPKDAAATALAARSLIAMGRSTGSCTLTGKVTLTKPEWTIPVVLKNNGATEMRVELSTPKGISVMRVNAGVGQVVQASGNVIQLSGNNTVFRRIPHLPPFSILSEHDAQTTNLEYVPPTDTSREGVALSLWSTSRDSELLMTA